jgi:methionyl-tRNA formyltransferase
VTGRVADARGRARVLFFGSGAFAVPILEALAAMPQVQLVGVVTTPDRPSGRRATPTPTPVAAAGTQLGLPLLQPPGVRAPETLERLAALRPDVAVLADYGRIIPPSLLALPPHGFLNVHPSILPRHRGAAPVPGTILAGDAEGGVTLMVMDEGLDSGPILAIRRWPLPDDIRAPDLEAAAAATGAALMTELLPGWLGGTLTAQPQNGLAATMTRPLRREDGRLDPGRPAVELERAVRAFDPWPGTWVETSRGRLAVLDAGVAPGVPGDQPGRLVETGRGLALTTVDGRLDLRSVRPAGGVAMSGEAYRRGAGREVVGQPVISPAREAGAAPGR